MIPYSRPKLSDFHTLSQTDRHVTAAHTQKLIYKSTPPPPPGVKQISIITKRTNSVSLHALISCVNDMVSNKIIYISTCVEPEHVHIFQNISDNYSMFSLCYTESRCLSTTQFHRKSITTLHDEQNR